MAPELKRVRSKPAEWWAAQPTTSSPPPAQEAVLPPKKRERAKSLVNTTEKDGHKGQAVKRKSRGEENQEDMDPKSNKPVQTGRSSVGENEMRGIGSSIGTIAQRKPSTNSKRLPDNEENDELAKAPKRRKSSVPAHEEEDEEEDPLAEDHAVLNKIARPASHPKGHGNVAVQPKGKQPVPREKHIVLKDTNTTRRGRSSNTEAELRAVNYKETVTRKPSTLNVEINASGAVKEARFSKKIPTRAVDEPRASKNNTTFKIPALPQKIADTKAHEAITRRGRSSNTEADLQAINYKETVTRKDSSLSVREEGQVKSTEPKVPQRDRSSNQAAEPQALKEKTAATKGSGPSNPTSKRSSKDPVLSRRGRLSNTGVNYKETRTANKGVAPEPASKKQARTDGVIESPSEIMPKSSSITKGESRRGRSSNTEAELRAPINYKETRTLNKGAISEATAEPQSSINTSSKSKGKQATRKQDSVADSSQPGPSRRGGVTQEVPIQDADVEAISSKFSKSRTKSAARPTVVSKQTTSKSHSSGKNSEKTRKSGKATEVAAPKVAPPPAAKSKRASECSSKKRKSGAEEAILELPALKRQRSDRAQEQDRPGKVLDYQHLAAINRKVSHATIESKWEALPPSCAERISGLLQDIQKPVIARLGDDQKRSHASTALQAITRKLVTKISRGLPFPPGIRNNREDDFDFEKILDHTRSLESQLTPALHANELLEAELAKEKTLLVAEKTYLDELEGNAKAESSKRKQDARKLHALLQPSSATDVEGLDDDFGVNTTNSTRPVTLDLLQDEKLQEVVTDMQGHVDSIEGNLKQVEGISQAMAKSKAAVQATLFGRLDSTQYEDLVLG